MKILDRYIGKAVLTASLFAVSVLSMVLVLGQIFRKLLEQMLEHSMPLGSVLVFIASVLPASLTFTLPWGFLTAVLLVFGKLSAENELIALRSSGVSIGRACLSVLGLALVYICICLWINVDVAPRAQERMKREVLNVIKNDPISLFSNDQVIRDFPGHMIYVQRREGRQLFNILVYEMGEREEPYRVIHARSGEILTELDKKQIVLHLENAQFEQRDAEKINDLSRIQRGTMRSVDFPVSLEELLSKGSKRKLGQQTLEELLNPPDERNRTASLTEANKRFSFSFAALAFALVGIPLGITAQRKETSVGFLFSILIAFAYYFFIILASSLSNNAKAHPEYLIWLPNVLFIGLGLYLFSRQARK